MKNNQKGFSVVEVLIVAVIVGLIGTVGWLVYDRQKNVDKTPVTSVTETEDTNKVETQPETIAPEQNEELTIKNCDGNRATGPVDQSTGEVWKNKLTQTYTVYSIDQICNISDGSTIVTLKIDEMKLPVAIAVFDTDDNLQEHEKLTTCKSLGGEGARLYVTGLQNNKIEAECFSGHMGESVNQIYSFDYDTLTPTLVREE